MSLTLKNTYGDVIAVQIHRDSADFHRHYQSEDYVSWATHIRSDFLAHSRLCTVLELRIAAGDVISMLSNPHMSLATLQALLSGSHWASTGFRVVAEFLTGNENSEDRQLILVEGGTTR